MSLVVISPHLDDAVFSCGTLIATAALLMDVTIVTVFDGDEERQQEDRDAAALLGAGVDHLGLAEGAGVEAVFVKIALSAHHGTTFGPLGLRHADHVTVAEACSKGGRARVDYLYEELPYRVLWPEYLPHPLPTPILELPVSAAKLAAVRCYQSQLGGEPGEALWAGERYHRAP